MRPVGSISAVLTTESVDDWKLVRPTKMPIGSAAGEVRSGTSMSSTCEVQPATVAAISGNSGSSRTLGFIGILERRNQRERHSAGGSGGNGRLGSSTGSPFLREALARASIQAFRRAWLSAITGLSAASW